MPDSQSVKQTRRREERVIRSTLGWVFWWGHHAPPKRGKWKENRQDEGEVENETERGVPAFISLL